MFNSKYNNLLTVLLVIVIIVIVGLLAFFGYDIYRKYFTDKEAAEYLDQYFDQQIEDDQTNQVVNEITNVVNPIDNVIGSDFNNSSTSGGSSSSSTSKPQYKGFDVAGKIEIPKTGIEYPVLEKLSKKAIEVAVAISYGPGLNQPGNTVIVGHNYRNGLFFSNNKKLENGDKIYITDNSGRRMTYTIYNIFVTTPEDSDYMVRETNGATEISLSTCTDDSQSRLIICARAE